MKVTIPITITKYTPGPVAPGRLVSISDDKHQADILGVEYTDGSVKIPRYNDGESSLVVILNNGDINLKKNEDEYSPEMSSLVYEEIKDDYSFVDLDYSVGKDNGDAIRTLWYNFEIEDVTFVDQKRLNGQFPDEVFMNPQNAVIFDSESIVASVENFPEIDNVLCVSVSGRKFVLFNADDECALCTSQNLKMFAYDCSSVGIAGGSVPQTPNVTLFRFSIRKCSVTEGVVKGEGRLNVTAFGFEWNAYFDITNQGVFEIPVSSLEFNEA